MKKYTLPLLLLALAAVSCKEKSSDQFTISGTTTYEGCEGAPVYFSCGELRDTTFVKDNAFSFSGTVESPEVGLIQIVTNPPRLIYAYLVLEPADLKVEVSPRSTVSGSALNEAYNAYDTRKRDRADQRRADLRAVQNDDTLSDQQKAEKSDAIWDAYYKDANALYSEIFDAHRNDALGADALMSLADTREQFDSLYNLAGEAARNYPEVKREVARYESLDKSGVGAKFKDFTIEHGNKDGSPAKLSDYAGKGKYVLVDFWASWCGPCKEEMPTLKQIYEQFKGDRFEMVGVAVSDKRQDTEQIVPELGITWPVIYDAQRIPAALYGFNAIPHIILIGPDGTILARDLRGEEIAGTLAKYLK